VQLTDVTSDTATFSLIGPGVTPLDQFGATWPTFATHQLVQMGSCEVRVAVVVAWRYLDTPSSPQLKTRLRSSIVQAGVPLGERVWEQLRIEQGRPAPTKN